MAEAIKNILFLLLSEQCYDEYFIKLNFLDGKCFKFIYMFIMWMHLPICYLNCMYVFHFPGPCLKSTISKGLGMSIIAGSVMVKVPQILKIFQNKSAEGINLYGVCLELFAMSATISYSFINEFPFRYIHYICTQWRIF